MDEQSLDAIGILEGTGKASLEMDYLRHYERIFAGIRNDPIKLLEIGIADGASLRTWTQFFSRATIIGVDVNPACCQFASDRVRIEIGSQADSEFLAYLAQKYKPHVIIDDGSHQAAHMLLTFNRLFSSLAHGGFYIIEDVHLHYGGLAPIWHPAGGMTALEYFMALAQAVSSKYIESDCDPATHDTIDNIGRIEFISGCIMVQRKPQVDPCEQLRFFWNMAERADKAVNWYNLGLVLLQRNELERAETAAQRAVAKAPDNSHYLSRLAYIQALRGNLASAIEAAHQAVRAAPNEPGFQQQLADLEARLGKTP